MDYLLWFFFLEFVTRLWFKRLYDASFHLTIPPFAHHFCLFRLSSVAYRRHEVIKNKKYNLFAVLTFSLLRLMTPYLRLGQSKQSGVLSLETIQNITDGILSWAPAKNATVTRETGSGRVEKESDRQRQRGRETACEREQTFFVSLLGECHSAERA